MKQRFILTSLLCTFMASSLSAQTPDWVNYGRYEQLNAEVTVSPKAVLFGDSITDGWAQQRPEFFKENNFLGRGIGGQTTATILLRFKRDVVAHHPKYVVIMCGVNDIALNDYAVDAEHAFDNIVMMCDLAKANKIRPVLCTTTVPEYIRWRPELKDAMQQVLAFNETLRVYSRENHIRLVDYAEALATESGYTQEKYAEDGVHPNAAGYEVMENLLLKALK